MKRVSAIKTLCVSFGRGIRKTKETVTVKKSLSHFVLPSANEIHCGWNEDLTNELCVLAVALPVRLYDEDVVGQIVLCFLLSK